MSNVATEAATPRLTAEDRCDRCGAQAYVLVDDIKLPQMLLFCAHHGREHLPKLQELFPNGFFHDERDVLNHDRLRGEDHA